MNKMIQRIIRWRENLIGMNYNENYDSAVKVIHCIISSEFSTEIKFNSTV